MKKYFLLCLTFFVSINCNVKNISFENNRLYPLSKPYQEGYLQVSDIHQLYYAQFGNPQGVPVLVVHGGPGWGCTTDLTAFFDTSFYRVIFFDQRGTMKSKPLGEMKENTPQAAVHDMELLRKHLNIDKWILFGGSYGSLLSLLYGQTHPDCVSGFVLRGVFLGRKKDYEQLIFGMGTFFPEAWEHMVNLFSKEEQHDLINAMDKRIMNPDPQIHLPLARAFMYYDLLCATVNPNLDVIEKTLDERFILSVSRGFIHYAANNFFLSENQLLNNMEKITHIPAIIVHGRYDIICLPQNSYDLHKKWPKSELWFANDASHSTEEPSVSEGLKAAMDKMKYMQN